MKLPENKNERIKILAMSGLGGIAVLYAILQLIVFPVMEKHKKNVTKLEESQTEQLKMKQEFRKAQKVQAEYDTVVAQVQTLSAFLAQPILGTYLIGLQSGLEQFAGVAGLRLNPASEIGFAEIPGKKKDGTKYQIRSYGVRATGTGGYPELVELIRQLEESNPLLCISELSIYVQPASPEFHQLNLSIEWPVGAEIEKGTEEPPSSGKSAPPAVSATEEAAP